MNGYSRISALIVSRIQVILQPGAVWGRERGWVAGWIGGWMDGFGRWFRPQVRLASFGRAAMAIAKWGYQKREESARSPPSRAI